MADQWHYSSGGQQRGPVEFEKLQELAKGGQLQRNDMVWKEGMPEWQPADKVEGMNFPASAASSGPPSSAPAGGPPPTPSYGYRTGGGSALMSKIGLDGILTASGAVVMLLGTFLPWLSIDRGDDDDSLFGLDAISHAQFLFVAAFAVLALVAIKSFIRPSPLSRQDMLAHGIHLIWISGAALLLTLTFMIGKSIFGGDNGPEISFGPFFSLIGAGVMLAGGIISLVQGVQTRE